YPAYTSTSLTSSPNPSVFGQNVTLTASVGFTSYAGTPTGCVYFYDNGTYLNCVYVDTSGNASLTLSSLSVGNHTLTETYGGDSNFVGSSSGNHSQTVNKANTATTVSTSAGTTTYGQSVTFTANVTAVSPGAGTPSGMVTFKDGSTSLGTGTLSGGKAALATPWLAAGRPTSTANTPA